MQLQYFPLLLVLCLADPSAYQRGVDLVSKGQPAAAVPWLDQAVKTNPADAQAWKALGVAYAAQAEYRSAGPAFRRACELKPELEDACYYWGRAAYALDRYEESIDALGRALKMNASWRVWLGIAQAKEALGRDAESESAFRTAIGKVQGRDPEPAASYGKFLIRQGRLEDALAQLTPTLTQHPNSPEANLQAGRALLDLGKLPEALPRLSRAVELSPSSTQAHLLLGRCLVRLGRAAEAQPHLQLAAEGVK